MSNKADQQRQLSRTEKIVAIALILGFAVMIFVMFRMRADPNWDRMVFLFGSVEALVFGAAGALFGTSIQRSQTADAQESAENANQQANAAIQEAQSAQEERSNADRDARAGKLLRVAILEKERRAAEGLVAARADKDIGPDPFLKADLLQRDLDEIIELAKAAN